MSLSNVLEPNFYDIYCNSITANVPIGTEGPTGPTGPSGSVLYVPACGTWYMNNVVQSIPNNSGTIIKFDAFTNPSDFPTLPVTYSSVTGLFTCTKDCNISCSYQAGFTPGSSTGQRQIYMQQSNLPGYCGQAIRDILSGGEDFISASWNSAVKIGDTFGLYVSQNSGGSTNLTRLAGSPFTFTRIGITFMYEN